MCLCLNGYNISNINFVSSEYNLYITNCSNEETYIKTNKNIYLFDDVNGFILAGKGTIKLITDGIFNIHSTANNILDMNETFKINKNILVIIFDNIIYKNNVNQSVININNSNELIYLHENSLLSITGNVLNVDNVPDNNYISAVLIVKQNHSTSSMIIKSNTKEGNSKENRNNHL